MQKLAELAKNGANIIFQDQLPVDVPGLADLKNRQTVYKNLLKSFDFSKSGNTEISICKIGKGALLMGQNTSDLLTEANVSNETIAEEGLWFSRIKRAEGTCYFISNWSGKIINKQITIEASGKEAVMFDPMLKKMGKIHVEKINNRQSSIYLQLQPGETRIVQLYETKVDVPSFPIWDEGDTKIAIDGQWRVSFVEGGPSLPESFDTSELVSWTEKNEEMKKFSGTAKYSIQFDKPAKINTAYKLSLGEIHESATVILNGKKLGTLVGPEYSIIIDASLLKEKNNLDILVSNLMANRISEMDKRGIKYQKFYNINMSAKKRENYKNGIFSAEKWEPQPSGLLGPVVLQGLNKK